MRRVYPSSEIPADTDRAPTPGSVPVSSGAVQTGRADRIAKGKSFQEAMESEYKGAPHPGARNTVVRSSCRGRVRGTGKPLEIAGLQLWPPQSSRSPDIPTRCLKNIMVCRGV